MEYLPFEVTEYNSKKEDRKESFNSDEGQVWIKIGKLDISIKQSDDGKSVLIEALDAELCEQELGSIEVWFDDIQELPLNPDGTHPLKP